MSTRSLTHIHDDDGTILVTMYRHSDGYPSGHGKELAEFLNGFQIVNGIGDQKGKIANGMGCLAAQVVSHFKQDSGVGGIYLYPPGNSDVGEEYVYRVHAPANGAQNKTPFLFVGLPDGTVLFKGTADAVLEKISDDES